MTPAELLAALRLNYPKVPYTEYAGVPPGELLDRLAHDRLLKILVVIAGEGPRANGIPEMYYPSEYLNRDPLLRWISALITDGRYSGATYGPCIGHASPEALAGGLIGAITTGDAIYLDFRRGRIDLLDRARSLAGAAPRADGRARDPPPPAAGRSHPNPHRAPPRDPPVHPRPPRRPFVVCGGLYPRRHAGAGAAASPRRLSQGMKRRVDCRLNRGSNCAPAALVCLEEGIDLEAFLVAHNPQLVSLVERGMAQRGGASLEQVERAVARRERRERRRSS